MIRVLYFASLRERLGRDEESLDACPASVGELRGLLAGRGDAWQAAFAGELRVLAAVNHEMASDATALVDGDEVGFFPPVTGG